MEKGINHRELIDSWATRIGALGIVQIAARENPTETGFYNSMVFVASTVLLALAIMPLLKWFYLAMERDGGAKKGLFSSLESIAPTAFAAVTVGFFFPIAIPMIDKAGTTGGAIVVFGGLFIALVVAFVYVKLRRKSQ